MTVCVVFGPSPECVVRESIQVPARHTVLIGSRCMTGHSRPGSRWTSLSLGPRSLGPGLKSPGLENVPCARFLLAPIGDGGGSLVAVSAVSAVASCSARHTDDPVRLP